MNSDTGRTHSNRPLSRARALRQMRALYAAENKDAGATAGSMLNGPGGLLGVPGMGRKWGNRRKQKDCSCGVNVATKEQIAPGITRIRGNLCNVHGRYGPCDPSKSSARKPKGRKPRATRSRKPVKTPEQRAQERSALQSQNRAAVFSQLGIAEDAIGALQDLRSGVAVADDGGLVKMGLAEQAADGSYRLTPAGRAMVNAANSGDPGRARDILSGAQDRKGARDQRQVDAAQRKVDAEAKRAAAQAARLQKQAEREAAKAQAAKERAKAAKKAGKQRESQQAEREAQRAQERAQRLQERATEQARRSADREAARTAREQARDEARLRREDADDRRNATDPPKRRRDPPVSPMLVRAGDRPKVARPAKNRGKFSRSNVGARASKSLTVYKSASGEMRWLARSTTAYRDRDGEIITIKALDEDSQRMTASGLFGPFRFWHLGQPNPLSPDQPWGIGFDIGDCDYSTQIGTSRVESGTFRSPEIAARIAETADQYELSPGFFHPIDQPIAGVYEDIRTFERSIVPTKYGRASNLFTGLTVKEFTMNVDEQERRFKAAIEQLKLTPEQAEQLAGGLVHADKSAQDRGVAYKSDDDPWAAVTAALKAALVPTEKAPEAPASMEEAGETEIADAEMEQADDGDMADDGEYIGDMSPAEFKAMLTDVLAPVLKMQEMVKAIGDMSGELKTMYSTKDAGTLAEIATLKARLTQLEGDQPAVINSADVEAALKGAPAAPPDPNAPVIPDDPTRPYASVAAQTFPQLYSNNPDGSFGGWQIPQSPAPSN